MLHLCKREEYLPSGSSYSLYTVSLRDAVGNILYSLLSVAQHTGLLLVEQTVGHVCLFVTTGLLFSASHPPLSYRVGLTITSSF